MAGGCAEPGRPVTARALDLLGAFDTGHRAPDSDAAGRPGRTCRWPRRTAWWPSSQPGAPWPGARDGRYEVGRRLWDLGLLAPVQRRAARGGRAVPAGPARRDRRHRAPGGPRGGPARCTSSGSPDRRRCRWSARSAAGCRCTPPASARCCSRMRRRTTSSEQVLRAPDPRDPAHRGPARPDGAASSAEVRRRGFARTSRGDVARRLRRVAVPVHGRAAPRRRSSWPPSGVVVPRAPARPAPGCVPVLAGGRPRASAATQPARATSAERKQGRFAGGRGAGGRTRGLRTQVGIVGARPGRPLLSHLLPSQGIDRSSSRAAAAPYVEARIRAGMLEQGTVDMLTETGVGERLHREGLTPRDRAAVPGDAAHARLRRAGGRRGLGLRPDRGGQGPDRGPARRRRPICSRSPTSRSHDVDTDRPRIRFTDAGGDAAGARLRRHRRLRRLPRHLPRRRSRGGAAASTSATIRSPGSASWPTSPPSTDELIYAGTPRLRPALACARRRSPGSTCRSTRRGHRRLVRRPDLGRTAAPPRAATAGS